MNSPKKTYVIFTLIIILIGLIAPAHGANDPLSPEERRWLIEHDGKIRINHESGWAPILFTDKNGEPSGISADYYRLIEQNLNFKFKRDNTHYPWETVLARFNQKKIDVICAVMKNKERSKNALFTKPYIDIKSVIIVRKEVKKDLNLAMMGGMNVAVVNKDITHEYLAKQYGFLNITPYKDTETCMLEVAAGTVDGAVVSLAVASHIMETTAITNLRIAGSTGYSYHLSFASRKDWPILNRILNKGLDLISQKEKNEIYNKWIRLDVDPFYKKQNFWFIILGIAGLGLSIIAMILVWNRRLHQEVEKRTASLAEQTIGLQKEVSARKKVQKELEERETHLRTLVGSIPDMVWLKDPKGVYISCNPEFEKVYGAKEAEIIGRTDFDFVEKDQAMAFLDHDRAAISSDAPLVIEERFAYADGRHQAHLETIKTPMYDHEGKLIGILGIGRDITERKLAEEKLNRYRNRLESILSNIQGLTYRRRLDTHFTMLFMSPHVKELTGYPPEDFIDNAVRPFDSIIHKEDRQTVNDTIHRAIGSSVPWELEYRIHHKDGSVVWVFEKGTAVHGDPGHVKSLDGFIININKLKLMEEHLRQAQKMEAIGSLASGIAHDFNNILAGILGFSELLQEDIKKMDCSEKMHRRISNILKGGIRAKDLVAQILAFSRTEDEIIEPVSISRIAKEAVRLLPATLPSTIKIKKKFLSSQRVMGDATKIHQVVMNLCTNAGYAMKKAGGVLSISIKDVFLGPSEIDGQKDISPGPFICLCVEDTGQGMDRATQKKIMQPFFTTKPKGEGTGMGLWLVHGIVKKMGGFIRVSSSPGQGTKFDVYLPAVNGPAGLPLSLSSSAGTSKNDLIGNERILFIDDEKTLTQLTWEFLSDLGYHVTVFNSGVSALAHITSNPETFDLVITDMTMPEMTGDELSRKIRTITPGIPIILTTGIQEDLDESGVFDAVLRKPVLIDQMAEAIRNIMYSRKGKI